jgi:hypothetical protein
MMMLFVVFVRSPLSRCTFVLEAGASGDGFGTHLPRHLEFYQTILIFSFEHQCTLTNSTPIHLRKPINMADAEAAPDASTAPSEPQSRHIVYCGGSCHPITPPSLPQLTTPSTVCSLPPEVRSPPSPFLALAINTSLRQEEVVLRIRRDGKEMSGLAEESTSRDV